MAVAKDQTEHGIRQLTREETIALFDAQVRQRLGMSGDEFLRRLDAGEFDEIADDVVNHPGLMYLIMLSESVR